MREDMTKTDEMNTDGMNNGEMNTDGQQEMDWKEMLAYGCAISVGALATLLIGASVGGIIGKAVKSVGAKKGAEILTKTLL